MNYMGESAELCNGLCVLGHVIYVSLIKLNEILEMAQVRRGKIAVCPCLCVFVHTYNCF